jgi:hypothetical protein
MTYTYVFSSIGSGLLYIVNKVVMERMITYRARCLDENGEDIGLERGSYELEFEVIGKDGVHESNAAFACALNSAFLCAELSTVSRGLL